MDLSLIILLPTFLGGIWQLLELSSISTSFIRFFSISQLIPDGLLILFIFIIIYISVIVSFNMFGKKPFNVDSSKKSLSIWNGILLMSLGSIMFIFGLLPVFQSIYQKRNIQIGEIAIIIPSLMFTVGGFVIGIWRVILSFLQNNKEKTKEVYEKLKGRKELKKNIISFLKIVTISLFFFYLNL